MNTQKSELLDWCYGPGAILIASAFDSESEIVAKIVKGTLSRIDRHFPRSKSVRSGDGYIEVPIPAPSFAEVEAYALERPMPDGFSLTVERSANAAAKITVRCDMPGLEQSAVDLVRAAA